MITLYALAYTLMKLGLDYRNPVKSLEDRIILQKSIYLLKTLGYDMKFHFNWYLKGPYSPQLADQGYSLQNAFSSPVLEGKILKWLNEIQSKQDYLNLMKGLLLPRSDLPLDKFKQLKADLKTVELKEVDSMEIAASLIYIYESFHYSERETIIGFLLREKPMFEPYRKQIDQIAFTLSKHKLIPNT